jgi:tRNA A37 threonylcarbamoyladenosine dehydratase
MDSVLSEDYLNRFSGIARLYGTPALKTFSQSHIIIIGLGGVGSWCVEALARTGINQLSLIDMDDLCISNTNRQLHALDSTIGDSKAQTLKKRIHQINPNCKITLHETFLTSSNLSTIIPHSASPHTVIIDAIDQVHIKVLLAAHCLEHQIPLCISGSAGGRRDPALIASKTLDQSGHDPMLKQVRRKLRDLHPSLTPKHHLLHCVFSKEQPHYPQADNTCSTSPTTTDTRGYKLDCRQGYGASTPITGTFAFQLTHLALTALVKANP